MKQSNNKVYCLYKDDQNFMIGDLVQGYFSNEFVLTFSKASEARQGSLQGDGAKFHKNELGLVVDVIATPESFYSIGFSKLLLKSGEVGWLPNRWLIKAGYDAK